MSSTDFDKRVNTERAQTTSLADYDGFIARTNAAYAGMSAKRMVTAHEVAQVLYDATTDGTNRLRYFTGEDTGGLVKARRELSDMDYIAFVKSKLAGALT